MTTASPPGPVLTVASPSAVIESKPRAEAQPLKSLDASELWQSILEKAAASPRESALLSDLVCRSFAANVLSLALPSGGTAGDFVRGNVEMVRATIVRLAGRPIEVRVDVEAQSSPRPPTVQRGLVSPEIRDHPIVKLAADLFDAAIVDVTPLQRGDATPHDDAAVSDRLDSGFENTSGQ